jgi:hypothetical protein
MRSQFKSTLLSVFGVAALAIAVPMTVANAQDPGTQRRQLEGQRAERFGGQQQDPRMQQMMQQRMGGGGGGSAMVQDNRSLYILQGNQVFKLNKENLQVTAQSMLPMGGRGGQQGGGPGTDRVGRRQGGGGEQDFPMEFPGDPIPPTE